MGERIALVIVGGGSSTRMGGLDKIWVEISGKPLFMYSFERFLPLTSFIALVVHADRVAQASAMVAENPAARVVAGGTSRRESVWNGLRALPDADFIAVHDAARPLAPATLLTEGLRHLVSMQAAGAVPSLAVTDTIKRVDYTGTVLETMDRTPLRAVQTPQVFRAGPLMAAHASAADQDEPSTDDAMLLEARGERVITYPGATENFKVTTPLDLRLAQMLLEQKAPA